MGIRCFRWRIANIPRATCLEKSPRPQQALPTKPAPFARQMLTENLLTNRTPEIHQWALQEFREFRSAGQFVPFSVGKDTVIFPGFDGGAEWGGSAADPETGISYVNANDLAWTAASAENKGNETGGQRVYLSQCSICHRDDRAGSPPDIPSLRNVGDRRSRKEIAGIIRTGKGRMPGFAGLHEEERNALIDYLLGGAGKELSSAGTELPRMRYRFTGYHRFLDPDGYPAVAPPWGTLNAINLNTGEYAWKVPFGEYPELAAKGLRNTGTENYGGPIVTAGGLVFHRRHKFRQEIPRFRQVDRRAPLGDHAAICRQWHSRHL